MKTVVLTALIALAAATLGHAQQGVPDGEWPTYGGDAGSTKYSLLDQIDADNVERDGVFDNIVFPTLMMGGSDDRVTEVADQA